MRIEIIEAIMSNGAKTREMFLPTIKLEAMTMSKGCKTKVIFVTTRKLGVIAMKNLKAVALFVVTRELKTMDVVKSMIILSGGFPRGHFDTRLLLDSNMR